MSTAKDPFESYLQRASELFESGDVVKAGQIWQAILKKQPGHEAARTGLYKVKVYFDARATQDGLASAHPLLPVAPAVPLISANAGDPELARLLELGCTLYDAGQVEPAIDKWEQVLKVDPENALAKGYINGAKRVQIQGPDWDGVEPPTSTIRDTTDFAQEIAIPAQTNPEPAAAIEAPPPAPAPLPPPAPEVDVEQLLRDGCTLYDMGQPEDALKKWERALIADPRHVLARSYIKDARKDLGLPPLEDDEVPAPAIPEAPASAASATVAPDDERLEQLIREGVQLFDMGMAQEALVKWQQVLDVMPEHRDAKAYLAMAEKDIQTPAQAPSRSAAPPKPATPPAPPPFFAPQTETPFFAPMEPISLGGPEPKEESTESASSPVAPPQALTTPTTSTTRKGLSLPAALQGMTLPSWLNSPIVLLGAVVGLVVLIVGSVLYHRWRKDVVLRDDVATLSAQALQPVVRNSQIISLDDSPDETRKEAEKALHDDPLLAYYRAQELLRLSPNDAPAAELLERAKAGMANAATSPAPTLADYERQRQEGDLDSAYRSVTQMLLLTPDDASMKERAARVCSALSLIHATKDEWQETEDALKKGRALVPSDKSWNARMKLLEHVKQMSKADRYPWIQILG